MHLLIDYREKAAVQNLVDGLLQLSNPPKESFRFANLHLGDFQFVDDSDDGNVYMIIERKTVNDLAASIKDGRYMEQKMRLLSKRRDDPSIKIAYIIEGEYSFSPSFTCAHVNNKSLSGVIINSNIRDNIIVWSTKNISDTNDLIMNLHMRFTKDPHKYFENKRNKRNDDENENELYASTVIANKLHSKKKDNFDVNMCLQVQLSCIPGLSSKKAQRIIQELGIKSLYDLGCILMKETVENKERKGKSVLQGISGIGIKLETTIKEFVLGGK